MANLFKEIGKINIEFTLAFIEKKLNKDHQCSLEEVSKASAENLFKILGNKIPVLSVHIQGSENIIAGLVKTILDSYLNREDSIYQIKDGQIVEKKWRLD